MTIIHPIQSICVLCSSFDGRALFPLTSFPPFASPHRPPSISPHQRGPVLQSSQLATGRLLDTKTVKEKKEGRKEETDKEGNGSFQAQHLPSPFHLIRTLPPPVDLGHAAHPTHARVFSSVRVMSPLPAARAITRRSLRHQRRPLLPRMCDQ